MRVHTVKARADHGHGVQRVGQSATRQRALVGRCVNAQRQAGDDGEAGLRQTVCKVLCVQTALGGGVAAAHNGHSTRGLQGRWAEPMQMLRLAHGIQHQGWIGGEHEALGVVWVGQRQQPFADDNAFGLPGLVRGHAQRCRCVQPFPCDIEQGFQFSGQGTQLLADGGADQGLQLGGALLKNTFRQAKALQQSACRLVANPWREAEAQPSLQTFARRNHGLSLRQRVGQWLDFENLPLTSARLL